MNTRPYEIIAAPFTVWTAPVATMFPDITVTPTTPWVTVGTSGNLNYLAEGVTVEHSQSMNFFRALGDAGSRKAFRTEEDLKIRLTLADVTLEQYAHALNGNPITAVAGVDATGAGYLVNKTGGVAVGATTIPVDGGTGTIPVGARVRFGVATREYTGKTALAGGNVVLTEALEAAVADNAAVTVLSVTGTRTIGLSRGFDVDTRALLIRGMSSPYLAVGALQYEVPRAAQSGSPEAVSRRDQPVALALEWTALVDPAAADERQRFGRLVAQAA